MVNSVELKEKRSLLADEYKKIIETCKNENRSLTDEEQNLLDEKKTEIENINEELRKQKETLENYEKTILIKEEETRQNKNISTNQMKTEKISFVKEIRKAMENGTNQFTFNATDKKEERAIQVTGANGVEENIVETELQGILAPLYAESVLTKLGCRWYRGLPMGNISVPKMSKGSVTWADETAAASASTNTFSNVVLKPNRLTAYVDISKMLIAQDNLNAEAAIREDIVKALQDKLEATILGYGAKGDNTPAGIFASGILGAATTVDSYEDLCDAEADLEDANVTGEMKYLLNPKGKAILRSMAKSALDTTLVMQGGTVDGVEAVVTSNVKDASTPNPKAVYGNFNYLAIGQWDSVEVVVDPYTQSVNGCIRLVITAYFDAKVLRPEAFKVMTLARA